MLLQYNVYYSEFVKRMTFIIRYRALIGRTEERYYSIRPVNALCTESTVTNVCNTEVYIESDQRDKKPTN